MAETPKTLGQVAPNATTATTLYTVPAATAAVISTLVACNRGVASGTFRIAIRVGGAATENKHYITYDCPLSAYAFTTITIGITLAATDIVEVYASSADFSFNLFGVEVT